VITVHFERMITAVDSHTEGMPTRVVTSGFNSIPGKTMFEKKRYVEEHLDHLRTLLMFEPRGHGSMSGSILLPPTNPAADLGIVFIEVSGCLPMCGHGTIGTCTVAIETGLVKMTEPITQVTFDTPAGLVSAEARVKGGRVKSVKIWNVPSFLHLKDVEVKVDGFGKVMLDIAFGGNFYGILPAENVRLSLDKANSQALIDCGMKIMKAVRQQIPLAHPLNPAINEIKHIMFTGPPDTKGADAKNTVVLYPGTLDRSPCGTGTSARMAQLYARGELTLNKDFVHESIIGSLFTGRLEKQERLTAEIVAVLPTIEGRAWITGFQQFVLDPEDPFPAGFSLSSQTG
jgi:proline racemase